MFHGSKDNRWSRPPVTGKMAGSTPAGAAISGAAQAESGLPKSAGVATRHSLYGTCEQTPGTQAGPHFSSLHTPPTLSPRSSGLIEARPMCIGCGSSDGCTEWCWIASGKTNDDDG